MTLNYADIDFVKDLSQGMPFAGAVSATPGLTARKKDAEMTYKERKEGIRATNLEILDRVRKSQAIELAEISWGATLEEVERGWITDPSDVPDDLLRAVPLTPRFAISEHRGNQAPKVRPIGDFRASAINGIAEKRGA